MVLSAGGIDVVNDSENQWREALSESLWRIAAGAKTMKYMFIAFIDHLGTIGEW